MSVLTTLREVCITLLVAGSLAGCGEDGSEVTGHWRIDQPGCLSVCGFYITDMKWGKQQLQFDDEKAQSVPYLKGDFYRESEGDYYVVFPDGEKFTFTLSKGKLVADEGTVFKRLTEH